MRLVTYDRNGARRLGALVEGSLVDLPDAVGHPAFPRTMEELVARNGGSLLAAAREALDHPDALEEFGVEQARLLVPLLPASIVEFAPAVDGPTGLAVLGPDAKLAWPRGATSLTCHVEVACVVGKPGRNLTTDGAARRLFGYTIMAAWSTEGRFATSLGPSIVTADELGLDGAEVVTSVDGEVVWTETLRPARRLFARAVAGASRLEDVAPGDVFGSTAFGASWELALERRRDRSALVEVSVEGIGVLRTRLTPKVTRPRAASGR